MTTRARTVHIDAHLEVDDELSDESLPSVAQSLADGVTASLARMPRLRAKDVAVGITGRVRSPGPPMPGAEPLAFSAWDARELRRLCDSVPDDLVWDAEKHDRGDQAREGESADYVDGFNDALGHARAIARQAQGALADLASLTQAYEALGCSGPGQLARHALTPDLGQPSRRIRDLEAELEATRRACKGGDDDAGIEHLELWRALAPFARRRRRVYNALVAARVTAPGSLRALDARALRGIHRLGNTSIGKLSTLGLVDAAVAEGALRGIWS